jgi:hypothetical protein
VTPSCLGKLGGERLDRLAMRRFHAGHRPGRQEDLSVGHNDDPRTTSQTDLSRSSIRRFWTCSSVVADGCWVEALERERRSSLPETASDVLSRPASERRLADDVL